MIPQIDGTFRCAECKGSTVIQGTKVCYVCANKVDMLDVDAILAGYPKSSVREVQPTQMEIAAYSQKPQGSLPELPTS